MKKLSTLVILLAILLQGMTQDIYPALARPGAKGIFILTGDIIPDAKGPVTGYKIERKAGNDKDYTVVANLSAVSSVDEFKKRALATDGLLPYQQDFSQLHLDSIWTKGKAAGNLAKLKALGYATPVLAGFNMLWLDEKVQPGKSYQYRVTAIGGTYVAQSLTVTFAPLKVATPRYQKALFNKPQHHMQLYWRTPFTDKPDFIETWRREDDGPYTKVPAIVGFLPGKDTVQYMIKDTSARHGHLYRYYLKAYDVLGNAAALTDTITIASLDPVQMPLPQQVKALGDSSIHGINISWKLPEAPFIKMLTLYRSTNSVKGYVPVATLSATDTSFYDQQVRPATAYFYYFEVVYKTQEQSRRSTAFAASYLDNQLPGRPRKLEATGNQQGIALTWEYDGGNTNGFWLYRAERGHPLQLISTMIPVSDTVRQYSWTDTDSLLRGDRFYAYALQAISTSHVAGKHSDTAVARPLKNIPVPRPPMQVTAHAEDGRVYVNWDAVSNYDVNVSGYKLLRSKKAAGAASYTTDTIYCSSNQYVDTQVIARESYRYSIITQSMLGVQSVPATWTSVKLNSLKPAAPASLTANLTKTGIQLNWEAPGDQASMQYVVYRYERGSAAVKAGTVAANTDQYTDTSATKGKHYFYFVRSLSPDRTESDNSNEASIRY